MASFSFKVLGVLVCVYCISAVLSTEVDDSLEGSKITDAPYLASIEVKNKYLCAASIVDEIYVVTSKSCVKDLKVNQTKVVVRAGTGQLSYSGQAVRAISIILDSRTDFAIVQTGTKIKYTNTASWVNPNNEGITADLEGTVTAWKNKQQKKSPLLIAPVKALSYSDCNTLLNGTYTVSSSQACLQPTVATSKSCLADLGAPFYLNDQLYGIVSYAPGCQSKLPLVVSSMQSGASFTFDTLTGSSGF